MGSRRPPSRRATLNRTIVGWKRSPGGGGLNSRAALNRTIVGWKRGPGRSCWGMPNFKSHHSGMETAMSCQRTTEPSFFKSHHSGMETSLAGGPARPKRPFKSHHSGMETGYPGLLDILEQALNRTIVGWKQEMRQLTEAGIPL